MLDEKKLSEKAQAILADAKRALSSSGWDGHTFDGVLPDTTAYLRVRTEALNLIGRVCGRESDHYRELQRVVGSDAGSGDLLEVIGVIEAAIRDFEGGFLFDVRTLVAAEILDDFIEQARELLDAGYHVPAVSLAGAVLEDGLRKLCDRHGVPYPEKPGIEKLNVAVAKANHYDKLVQKRITHLADLRNKADHGEFSKVTKEDAKDMIDWLRRFAADYLGG